MSDHIRDDSGRPTPATSTPADDIPPVDPDTLADYAEFKAFKESQKELQGLEDQPEFIELVIDEEIKKYKLVALDQDALAHFHLLTSFADDNADTAITLFESLLEPDAFDAFKKDLKPALRSARRAMMTDPEAPSITDIYIGLAKSLSDALMEYVNDPKRGGSLGGPSHTGPKSKQGSTRSAIPSVT